jgi:HEAT repeat protein
MVAVFVQALADDDRIVRQLALAGLKSLPPEALVQFQSQLLSLLEKGQEEAGDRAAIAQLIGRLGSDAAPAFAVLARLARDDPGAEVRLQCLLAASRLTSNEQAAAMFRAALADGDAKVRKLAVVRLGALGPASAAAVGDLAKTLKDQDEIVREYAAVSLGKLGVIGSPAIGALIEAFGDPAERVRRAAADALAGVGDAAVDPLVRQLEAGPPQTRQLAIVALSRLGATAKRAEPALRKRLEDPDPQVRELAQAAMEVLASFR